jgi:hypothetical protein
MELTMAQRANKRRKQELRKPVPSKRRADGKARMQVWFLEKGAEVARAVGRIVINGSVGHPKGLATGFLVSRNLLVTCNHVLPSAEEARTSIVQFDYRVSSDGSFPHTLEFGFDVDRFFATNASLDVTVVAIASPNAAGARVEARGSIPLDACADPPLIGQPVLVLHHPSGEPLSVSFGARVLRVMENFIFYEGDTEPGSAGAPVLNSNWQAVGLHHSSVPRLDHKNRWLARSGAIWESAMGDEEIDWVAKEAVGAASIKSWLDGLTSNKEPEVTTDVALRPESVVPVPPLRDTVALGGITSGRPRRDSVFVSYAHADQKRVKWVDRLDLHLRQIPRLSTLVWSDSRIESGADWRSEIEHALASARAAVLLIGPNFLVSRFILQDEVPRLLEAANEQGVRIFPVITDPAAYEESILGRYQCFNQPKRPLSKLSGPEQNETLLALARAVARVFQ